MGIEMLYVDTQQAEGTLVHIIRAYTALYLGGTSSQRTGTSPPSCLLLNNRPYMSTDSHMKTERTSGQRGSYKEKMLMPQLGLFTLRNPWQDEMFSINKSI